MDLETAREHYLFELQRKQKFEAALTLPTGVLAALGGVVGFYLRRFHSPHDTLTWCFAVGVFIGILLLALAFWFLVRSFLRYTYAEIAPLGRQLAYYQQLQSHASRSENPDLDVDEVFLSHLREKYAKAVDRNSLGNVRKAASLYWTKVFLASSAVALSLSAIPYVMLENQADSKPQLIELINADGLQVEVKNSQPTQGNSGVRMPEDEANANDKTDDTTPAAGDTDAGSSDAPTGPDNIDTRQGDDPSESDWSGEDA